MAQRSSTPTEENPKPADGGVVIPGKPERALKHEFVPKKGGPPEYRYCQGEWVKSVVSCVIDDLPFSEGALRGCYRMQLVQRDGQRHDVVAKVSKDPAEDKATYYRDVQAQMCSKEWAAEFNGFNVPKPIDFVPAYVFELVDRPGRPLIGVEEFVEGVFQKHNNNVGGTAGDSERATPNAFSHFTWEASNHSLLVCDIQGVNDRYTDPQIHTASGKGFGKGNLGQAGLQAFLTRHRCTQICELLGLPSTGGGFQPPSLERQGTPILRNDPALVVQGASIHVPVGSQANASALPSDSDPVFLQPAPSFRSFKQSLEDSVEEGPPSPEASANPPPVEEAEAALPVLDKSDDLLMDQILDELSDL